MGETYKGLTIRFGGDTTSLQQALRGVNANITNTQSEIRRLKQALRFDPSSMVALRTSMEATNSRAQSLAERMDILGREIASMGNNVEDVVNDFQKYQEGLQAFNKANAEVTRLNEKLAIQKDAITEAAEAMGPLWTKGDIFDKQRREIAGMVDEFAKMSPEAEKMVYAYRRLQEAQAKWTNQREINRPAAQLVDLATEFIKCEAEAKSLNAELLKIEGSSIFMKDTESAKRFNKKLDETRLLVDRTSKEAQKMRDAFQFDPSSMQAASRYMKSFKEATNELNGHALLLKRRINELSSSNKQIVELASSANKARTAFLNAANKVEEVNGLIGKQKNVVLELERRYENLVSKGEDFAIAAELVNGKLTKAKQELTTIYEVEKDVLRAFKVAQGATELRKLQAELVDTESRANELKTSFDKLTNSIKINGSTLTTIGMSLYSNVTPQVMMMARYSVEAANEIDSAFRDLRKTVNATEEEYTALKNSAQEFASTHITDAQTLLEIEAMGGQLGLATEQLETFALVCSNLDIATDMNSDEISEQLGQLNNVLGWSTLAFEDGREPMERYADALVRLGNNMPAQESAISEVTSRIASQASIIGFTTPQILAWATAIASTGQKAESASTAIANTMADLELAASNGGEALELFAQITGMTADEFTEAWSKGPSDVLLSFIEGLKNLDAEGESVTQRLYDLGITGVRQIQAIEGLTNTTTVLNDALVISQDAWDGIDDAWGNASDAAAEAARKSEGFSGQLQIMKNNASMLGAEFAESLTPVIELFSRFLKGVLDFVEPLPDSLKLIAVAVSIVAASVGPLSTVIGPVMTLTRALNSEARIMQKQLNTLAKSIDASADGMLAAESATRKLSTAQKLAVGSAAALGAALAGLVLAKIVTEIIEARKQQELMTKATKGLTTSVKNEGKALSGSSSSIDQYSDSIRQATFDTSELKDEISEVIQKQSDLSDSINDTWTDYESDVELVNNYVQTIKDLQSAFGGTDGEVEALRVAVEGYNSATGASVEITDESTGQLSLSTDELEANTQAWMDNAKAQANAEIYAEVYKQMISDQKILNDAQKDLVEKTQQYYDVVKSHEGDTTYGAGQEIQLARDEMNRAAENVDDAREVFNAAKQSLDELGVSLSTDAGEYANITNVIQSTADVLGVSTDELIARAEELGVSGETAMLQYAMNISKAGDESYAALASMFGMTKEQLDDVAKAFGTSGSDAAAAYAKAIQDGAEPTSAAVSSLFGLTFDQFSKLAEDSGYESADEFAKAILSNDGKAVDAVTQMITDVHGETISAITQKGFDKAGSNISQGIAIGLMDGNARDALSSAVADMVDFIEARLSAESDAHSPARRFYSSGKFISQGIAVGFTQGIPDMQLAVRDGIQAMLDEATNTVDANLNTGFDINARLLGLRGVTNNISNTTGGSIYFNGVSVNDEPGIQNVLTNFLLELQRLGLMQG